MPSRAAAAFTRLVEIMATLRGPDGCPWDREQTIDSLKPFVLEETYEVLEAIDAHDHAALREELGDFVFEAVFLAQLESEAGHFTIADSLDEHRRQAGPPASARLRARRPAKPALDSAGAGADAVGGDQGAGAQRQRDAEDAAERHRAGAAGAAARLPDRHPRRVGRLRLGTTRDVVAKIQEEVDELREVVDAPGAIDQARAEEEMGDLLFSIANLSRQARHRAGDRAAQGERQVHETLRPPRAVGRPTRAER